MAAYRTVQCSYSLRQPGYQPQRSPIGSQPKRPRWCHEFPPAIAKREVVHSTDRTRPSSDRNHNFVWDCVSLTRRCWPSPLAHDADFDSHHSHPCQPSVPLRTIGRHRDGRQLVRPALGQTQAINYRTTDPLRGKNLCSGAGETNVGDFVSAGPGEPGRGHRGGWARRRGQRISQPARRSTLSTPNSGMPLPGVPTRPRPTM